MNTVQSRMMGQAIAERMYTSYLQANDRQLAQLVSKKINQSDALEKSRNVQPPKGLQPPQALAKVDLRSKALSFEQSDFLKDYRNSMLEMQSLAAEMVSGRAEVRETLAAGSDNPGVAEVSGRLSDITDRYTLRVDQIATGQVSRSKPLDADDPFPTASGSLHLETSRGSADLFMSGAGFENNEAMLKSFADQINRQNLGVTASVDVEEIMKMIYGDETGGGSADAAQLMGLDGGEGVEGLEGMDGGESGGMPGMFADGQEGEGALGGMEGMMGGGRQAVLSLESSLGGEEGMFQVNGTLADSLNITKSQGDPIQEALYSITKNGGMMEFLSSNSNSVMLDGGISALLKGTGIANISNITDAAESMADQLSGMVGKYNDMLSFLTGNSQRGTGVMNQLNRMLELPRSGDALERIGITRVLDGALNLNRSAFIDQSRREPLFTNQIVEDFAEDLRASAREGMKESSGSLVGPLEYVARSESKQLDPVNVLSTYSRNGMYNLMNLYAAGVLLNLNA